MVSGTEGGKRAREKESILNCMSKSEVTNEGELGRNKVGWRV